MKTPARSGLHPTSKPRKNSRPPLRTAADTTTNFRSFSGHCVGHRTDALLAIGIRLGVRGALQVALQVGYPTTRGIMGWTESPTIDRPRRALLLSQHPWNRESRIGEISGQCPSPPSLVLWPEKIGRSRSPPAAPNSFVTAVLRSAFRASQRGALGEHRLSPRGTCCGRSAIRCGADGTPTRRTTTTGAGARESMSNTT